MSRALLALPLLVGIGGCVGSLGDLRQQPVDRRARLHGDAPALAACVSAGLESVPANYWGPSAGNFRYELRQGAAASSVIGWIQDRPLLEMTFTQDAGDARVEIRRVWMLNPVIEREAWRAVERCAGTAVAVTPPLE
jgi:hypothetical protein